MKVKLLLLFFSVFFIYTNNILCQKVGDIITLSSDVKAQGKPIAIYPNLPHSDKYVEYLGSNIQFKVVRKQEEIVELRAINFTTLSKKDKKEKKKDLGQYYNDKIYKIARHDFDVYASAVELKETFAIGLLTLPFKARPQEKFSFDTEFNFNSTLNWRVKNFYNTSLNLQIGAGIGSVGLNESNSSLVQSQDIATLTVLSGLMFEYKKIQVGAYAGFDFINNQANYNWDSHGKVWFGFGIGYNLFSVNLAEKKPKTRQ